MQLQSGVPRFNMRDHFAQLLPAEKKWLQHFDTLPMMIFEGIIGLPHQPAGWRARHVSQTQAPVILLDGSDALSITCNESLVF